MQDVLTRLAARAWFTITDFLNFVEDFRFLNGTLRSRIVDSDSKVLEMQEIKRGGKCKGRAASKIHHYMQLDVISTY